MIYIVRPFYCFFFATQDVIILNWQITTRKNHIEQILIEVSFEKSKTRKFLIYYNLLVFDNYCDYSEPVDDKTILLLYFHILEKKK